MTTHQKHAIHTANAPQAIGPYSPGIRFHHLIFTAGQIAIVPETGEIIQGGIEVETRQVLTNLKHILEAAGASLQDVVKTTVFLRDMADFSAMNAIYAQFFTDTPPARSTIQVAGLPKGVAVEIEAIAIKPHGE